MVEPEVAFMEFEGHQALAEEFVVYLVARALERCREELGVLERDIAELERVQAPFRACATRRRWRSCASRA